MHWSQRPKSRCGWKKVYFQCHSCLLSRSCVPLPLQVQGKVDPGWKSAVRRKPSFFLLRWEQLQLPPLSNHFPALLTPSSSAILLPPTFSILQNQLLPLLLPHLSSLVSSPVSPPLLSSVLTLTCPFHTTSSHCHLHYKEFLKCVLVKCTVQ